MRPAGKDWSRTCVERRFQAMLGAFSVFLLGSTPAAALVLERSPYLMAPAPDAMVVRWRTDVATESVVRIGSSPGLLTTAITEPGPTTEHEVEVTGLQPDTRYYYAIGTQSTVLAGDDADHFFATPPPAGTRAPVRIWVVGDSGQCSLNAQGCIDAAAVKERYLALAAGNTADLWLLLGDNAYPNGSDTEYTAGFFDVYPDVTRNTVVFPALGNHEIHSGDSDAATQTGPFFDSFALPAAGQCWSTTSRS